MLLFYTAMIDDKPDQLRFERVYHSYRRQMLVVAERVLHDREEAEDAVQNALLGIAKNIKSLPSGDERVERAYVLTAAKNAALTMLPKKQMRDSMADISELNVASEEDLFRQVVNCQDYDLLLRAMRQMEPPYREVLMLVYVQEQSVKAAAAILCRKEETVRKQLRRGRKQLIELCRKEGMSFGQDRMEAL